MRYSDYRKQKLLKAQKGGTTKAKKRITKRPKGRRRNVRMKGRAP